VKNIVQQEGNVITMTAPANIKSGDVVVAGTLAGVAATDAASGQTVECSLGGVFSLPKGSGAIAAGTRVYFDPVNKVATAAANDGATPPNAFPPLGHVTVAAAEADAVCHVRLFQ